MSKKMLGSCVKCGAECEAMYRFCRKHWLQEKEQHERYVEAMRRSEFSSKLERTKRENVQTKGVNWYEE